MALLMAFLATAQCVICVGCSIIPLIRYVHLLTGDPLNEDEPEWRWWFAALPAAATGLSIATLSWSWLLAVPEGSLSWVDMARP